MRKASVVSPELESSRRVDSLFLKMILTFEEASNEDKLADSLGYMLASPSALNAA